MSDSDDFSPYPFPNGLDGYSLREFMVWCAGQSVSDIHIQGGDYLVVSRYGRLRRASHFPLADDVLSKLVDDIFTQEVRAKARGAVPVDRALQLDGDEQGRYGLGRGERLRFRCNFVQSTIGRLDSTLAITLRVIPTDIPPLVDMGLEPDLFDALLPAKGLALLGGEVGSGKTTLGASTFRYCLDHFPDRKVTTIEDPIEYILALASDLLKPTQLQVGRHVGSFAEGIRANLRRALSVLGIGEMRDRESIEAGILAGQLGVFGLGTVHIHSPGEVFPRCVSRFPVEVREAVAFEMLAVLQYVVVQKLLRTTDGRRTAVREYIIFDDALRVKLAGMPYTRWGQHIDDIIRESGGRVADKAWQLYLAGRIAESELREAMSLAQRREFEARRTS